MQSFPQKEDAIKFLTEKGIKILNLCHIPEDGRLKTLSFSATDKERLKEVLELGERVDGSSLFSFIEPGKSDIYIKPLLNQAFVNPFAPLPTLNILCSYMDQDGKPLDVAPQTVLARAEEKLASPFGVTLKALAELEFYIFSKMENEPLFPASPDKNYHESAPFSLFENVRNEILATLAEIGIPTKYTHSEVGRLKAEGNMLFEQHEVELASQSLADLASVVPVAKWVIRNVCAKHGVSASFVPKIALEHAGTGMHIHLCALKNDKNIVADSDGNLSLEAKKMIGGILKLASSLSAFGNPTPISYLRFVARKESPMHICWSARNRLALIRIPLWWKFDKTMRNKSNCRETFEYRGPDAFANCHLLLAGITLAVNHGLASSAESLAAAEALQVDAADKGHKLKSLPRSCFEAAESLEKDRAFYEAGSVFSKRLIDKTIEKLKAYHDKDLWKNLSDKPQEIQKIVSQFMHYG
ncbi:MAG: glutamine synthetase family protein [Candidatus Bathyarchaeia archaeon]